MRNLIYHQKSDTSTTNIIDHLMNSKKVYARTGRKSRKFKEYCCTGKEFLKWVVALVIYIVVTVIVMDMNINNHVKKTSTST